MAAPLPLPTSSCVPQQPEAVPALPEADPAPPPDQERKNEFAKFMSNPALLLLAVTTLAVDQVLNKRPKKPWNLFATGEATEASSSTGAGKASGTASGSSSNGSNGSSASEDISSEALMRMQQMLREKKATMEALEVRLSSSGGCRVPG
jgi:hypothetical protein